MRRVRRTGEVEGPVRAAQSAPSYILLVPFALLHAKQGVRNASGAG